MAHCLDSTIEKSNEHRTLCEAKAFQQARERTLLRYPLESYPCRMKMKESGFFIVRNKDGIFVAVCLYCEKAFIGWNRRHNSYKVHKILSPECVFILNAQNIRTPSSPIIDRVPRRAKVQPSSHRMAELPKRIHSFEGWPYQSPHPPVDVLAEAGLFYTGQNTAVECFFCHGRRSILRSDDDLMLTHTEQCKYAKDLIDHLQRKPLDIKASKKVYKLVNIPKNGINFYILQCVNASTPGILLSALASLPYEHELNTSDQILKRLQRNEKFEQRVNWATSSDGPLVNILEGLADDPEDLSSKSAEIQSLIEESSILSTDITNTFNFQCQTCLTSDASPHAVPIKCCHLGLCLRECFPKWMTCVICGYTLGKAIRVHGV